jgi:hypothetical protein
MAARIHRPLNIVAFNANDIARQGKQLQIQLIEVALLSETHWNLMKCFIIQIYHIYQTDYFPDRKSVTAVAVREGIPYNHVHLPRLVSEEATWVCIPIDNSEKLIAAVYESPGRAWIDADIIDLLCQALCILYIHIY